MPNDDALDIGTIDLKALSPEEYMALKQRIIRRAHAERTQAIKAMFAWLFGRRRGALRGRHGKTIDRQSGDGGVCRDRLLRVDGAALVSGGTLGHS